MSFITLFEQVLPFVGEFFGYLVGVARIPMQQIMFMLQGNNIYFALYNFYTGTRATIELGFTALLDIPIIGDVLSWIFTNIFEFLFHPFMGLELWLALALAFAFYGFLISIVKFFVGIAN